MILLSSGRIVSETEKRMEEIQRAAREREELVVLEKSKAEQFQRLPDDEPTRLFPTGT